MSYYNQQQLPVGVVPPQARLEPRANLSARLEPRANMSAFNCGDSGARLETRANLSAFNSGDSDNDRSLLEQGNLSSFNRGDRDNDSDNYDGSPLQREEPPSGTEWISEAERLINIQKSFDADRRSPSDVSIFRVPNFLKDSKREAYVPKRVSLGPYHSGSIMECHKNRAFCRMATRFNINRNLGNDPSILNFYNSAKVEILKLEDKIRNSYELKFSCESELLPVMLILDGCFILEILRTLGGDKFPVDQGRNYYEPVFDRNKIDFTGFDFLNDILMLENQIPLIVLQNLLELELNRVENVLEKLFEVLVKSTKSKFYPFNCDISKWSWPQPFDQVHHLLGLLHSLIVYGGPEKEDQTDPNGPDVRRIPRAVELINSGIKIEPSKGGIKSIKFDEKRATIRLTPINITNHTEVLFRNLIALEACKPSEINYVTCYLSLMDELIDSEEDVTLLRKSGVVTNYLGSDAEVAELFNGLCKGVTLSMTDVFEQLKRKVDFQYRRKFKVWITEFMKEHFSSPWRSLALAGAIVGLSLTAVQTVYSVI